MELPQKFYRIGRQLAFGTPKSIAAAVMNETDTKDAVYDIVCADLTMEISGLCAKSNPSILRKTAKEDLIEFSWNNLHQEFSSRTPRYLQILSACVHNPSQSRNVHKQIESLIPSMCDAGAQLVSAFNKDMNATRRIKSVILRKGGLKKVAVKRLSALHICMSYDATSRMFESYGEDFDVPIKLWKEEVESGVRKEKELMASILKLERENSGQDVVKSAVKELEEHRAQMHPGYSFTGDNVDMRVLPRQMTIKNKAKDHHMFQTVAFKNRISPNHLPDDQPKRDINQEPFTTFLPSAEEQLQLVEELVVLVGNKWTEYVPALAWYADYIPKHIQHENMKETKRKTEKVN